MKFDWDPKKNESNFKKHKIRFEEAETVFLDDRAVEIFDEKNSNDEDRFIVIGISLVSRELMVCYCYRNGEDIIRIFSARRATKAERQLYERGG
ncbi:MAG: BrnT family toxin [Defluviitaleaceae bacterium]|nr:BrnT family toxin [Defluviitaleaceae bacterium]